MQVWEVVAITIAIAIAIIVVKIAITFNVTEWQKNRDKKLKEKLTILCPHTRIVKDGARLAVETFVISPPGTHQAYCQQCGCQFMGLEDAERFSTYYAANPEKLPVQQKKYLKGVRKLYGRDI